MSNYIVQVAIAVDQLGNALLGGWADETISSRAFRQQQKRRWYVAYRVINAIFFWQENHCESAYLAETRRMQTFPEDRR